MYYFCLTVKFGCASVQVVDRKVTFAQAPLHLTTWRLAGLKNTGPNHAYFQVHTWFQISVICFSTDS